MELADNNDVLIKENNELQEKVKLLNKQNEDLYEKYCGELKKKEEWFKAKGIIDSLEE